MAKIINNADLTPDELVKLSKDEIDWCYNALDCCLTREIHDRQLEAADEVAKNTAAFSRSLMRPVFEMTLRGTLIDLAERDRVVREFRARRKIVEHNFNRLVIEGVGWPGDFNYRSHTQLKHLFYKIMGIAPVKKRNAQGLYAPSVDRDALERISQYFSVQFLAAHVITLRELDKKIEVLEKDLDDDGRMRTSYNIAGTNSGRLSSSVSDYGTGGNNQNIERALRKIFVPDEGMKFCNIDLEQGDSRNVGAICWELFIDSHGADYAGKYLDACESGDLHTTVCKLSWATLPWPEDRDGWRAVADGTWYRDFSYRDGAKRLGHGTNYYGTPRTMAMHAKVEVRVIEEFQQKYFAAFPVLGSYERDRKLDNWHNWVRHQIEQFGFIQTPHYNRRRYFFGRPEDDRTLREAIAYAPQSMTADAIDTGLIRLWEWGRVQPLIQVHDSILFQFPAELEDEIVPQALELVKVVIPLKRGREFFVPCEAKVGFNWADASDKNPLGLIKYKPGTDSRKRPAYYTGAKVRTFQDMLNA